jgi:hypothetical protein
MLDVRTYRGLGTLPSAYSGVFAESSAESVFLTRLWFENFERTVLDEGQVATVYGVERGASGTEAVAALMLRGHARDGVLGPRRLTSLANYYTCFYGVAKNAGAEPTAVADALATALWADRGNWDAVDLHPLLQSAPDFSALRDAFRKRGIVVQPYFCFGNWYLEVGGRSFDEYLGTLSSVLRKNIPYNRRRFERSANNRLEIVTAPADVERALADYESVYLSSWKIPEAFPEFIRGLVRGAAKLGWLRLGVAYVEGRPAAAQIWLVCSGVASIYKIAYDEQYSKLSVGSVLTARLIEHVIDVDKVSIVDYLSGDDDYKSKWMSARREFWGLLALNPRTLAGALQIAKHVGGRFAKNKLSALRAWRQRAFPKRSGKPD